MLENIDILYFFEILYFFWYFWITWKYVSHDTSGRTNTKREIKLFLVFLNYLEESVTRRELLDKHN